MAVELREPTVELREPAVAWRIPLDRYHLLVDGGLLDERDRVELIEGVLVAMSPKGGSRPRMATSA